LADLGLPLLSGLCFGLYFVLMHLGAEQTTLWPLILARCVGTTVLSLLVLKQRHSLASLRALRAQRGLWKLIVPNAALDVGGSLFFVLASQLGRMDVAAVLSALYPGGTVLLARVFLKEKTNRVQTLGILAALVAIVLMTV
jgi:drug/metabolite transporter (DMT)-like permease